MSVVWLTAWSFNTPTAALVCGFTGTDLFEWNIGWDVIVAFFYVLHKALWKDWSLIVYCKYL